MTELKIQVPNFRDGIYFGTLIGFIIHYLYFRHINSVVASEEKAAQAYYSDEFEVMDKE